MEKAIKENDQYEIDLLPEFQPTQFQLEISLQNWAYLMDPDEKLTRKQLCECIDQIADPRVIIMCWMINTCVDGLKCIEDQNERYYMLDQSSKYMAKLQDMAILNMLGQRMIAVLCAPIKITDNAGFIQIWGDIIQIVIDACEKQCGIQELAFDPAEFPFCIQTSNTFLEERRNLQALYSRKSISTQWTQQPIQPLQASYGPNNQIRLVLQRSKHMIDLGKGVMLSFRPIMQFGTDTMPDIARKSFMCVTPVLASDFFNVSQITLNGNSICAQSNIPNDNPRNLFQNYYNSLISKKKYRIDGEDAMYSGLVGATNYGNHNVGFEETSVTHPFAQINPAVVANSQTTQNLVGSKFESDPFPRAIISKMWTYNQEFSLAPTGGAPNGTLASNQYYAGFLTRNGDMGVQSNFGGIPQPVGNTGAAGTNGENPAQGGVSYPGANFPMIGLMVTASVAEYKQFNERTQKLRMRFITATSSCYAYSGTAAIQTSTTNPIGPAYTAFSQCFELQNTQNKSTYATAAFQPATAGTIALTSNSTVVVPQISCYGTSVQGPFGTGACQNNSGNINRYEGQDWSQSSSTYFPGEAYSNLIVPMSDISIELDQIGTICCDSTQTIIQLNCSQANKVLSAYLQPGYFALGSGEATGQSGDAEFPPGNASAGGTSVQCQTFLQNCLIGSASYVLTDLVCRIDYQTYPDDAYPIVRELLFQPIAYQSIRSQVDVINNLSSQFTQRLSIGGSALLNAIMIFIIPRFPAPLVPAGTVCRPQDCLVDYEGFNVPSTGDARAIPTLDSCYIPWTQLQVQVDNKIYEANPIIPITNSSYASYLKAQEGAFAVFGKYLPQGLRSFVTSRFCYILPINPKNNREEMVVDQQVIVSITFDGKYRQKHAQNMGTASQTGDGKFLLQSFGIVSQSLVNCDYVKI